MDAPSAVEPFTMVEVVAKHVNRKYCAESGINSKLTVCQPDADGMVKLRIWYDVEQAASTQAVKLALTHMCEIKAPAG
jgi:hypothetical protein